MRGAVICALVTALLTAGGGTYAVLSSHRPAPKSPMGANATLPPPTPAAQFLAGNLSLCSAGNTTRCLRLHRSGYFVTIGDSLTAGAHICEHDKANTCYTAYGNRLARQLRLNVSVLGYPGFTVGAIYNRAKTDLASVVNRSGLPQFCIIMGGTNDALANLNASQTLDSFRKLYQLCAGQGVPTVVALPPHIYSHPIPPSSRICAKGRWFNFFPLWERIKNEAKNVMRAFLSTKSIPGPSGTCRSMAAAIVDWDPFLPGPAADSTLWSDCMHCSKRGYQRMADVLLDKLRNISCWL